MGFTLNPMGLIINLFVIRLFILCFFYYVDSGEKSTTKRKRGDLVKVDDNKKKQKLKQKKGIHLPFFNLHFHI